MKPLSTIYGKMVKMGIPMQKDFNANFLDHPESFLRTLHYRSAARLVAMVDMLFTFLGLFFIIYGFSGFSTWILPGLINNEEVRDCWYINKSLNQTIMDWQNGESPSMVNAVLPVFLTLFLMATTIFMPWASAFELLCSTSGIVNSSLKARCWQAKFYVAYGLGYLVSSVTACIWFGMPNNTFEYFGTFMVRSVFVFHVIQYLKELDKLGKKVPSTFVAVPSDFPTLVVEKKVKPRPKFNDFYL